MARASIVRHAPTGFVALIAFALTVARGHDTWVQTATNVVRPGDVVHVDFCLGNHGNGHRDFKLAGKLSSLDGATLTVRGPGGVETDLRPTLVDLGSAPREGYWAGRFVAAGAGLHTVSHTLDKLHRTTRAVKSCKTYVLVSESLDELAPPTNEHAVPLGHPFELVVETHPVLGCGPGKEIRVRLLHRGRPLPDHVVSFIPRGATLAADFDPQHERRTDGEGRCSYAPRHGVPILVVAHLRNPDERGEGHDATAYTAALVINVPERSPGRE